MSVIAGIDIGGTKTAVGLFDGQLNILKTASFPTAGHTCQQVANRCFEIVHSLCEELSTPYSKVSAVGVASPGPLDLAGGRVVHIPTLGWKDEPVLEFFEKAFSRPAALQNDANAAALAEYRALSITHGTVVYITVSTGVGAGIVINGKILDGCHSAAGELGHIKVVPNGRPCGCGGQGCLEAYASGTAIAAIAGEHLGRPISAREVFACARSGDADMAGVVSAAADYLGLAISHIYQIIDPKFIVLGGSVINDFDLLEDPIAEAVNRYTEPNSLRTVRIVKSRMDGMQGLIGAAYAAREALKKA